MEQKWYNTKEGITNSLRSLAGLNRLAEERYEAGYTRKEQLKEFVILGWYRLDTCGNFMRSEVNLGEVFPNITDVLTIEELWTIVKASQATETEKPKFWLSTSPDWPVPYDMRCKICGEKWSIKNHADFIRASDSEVIPMYRFVGKTLGDVKKYYENLDDTKNYRVGPEVFLRNDRFIDLSPKYPDAKKGDWEKDLIKNERGWVRDTEEGINDSYIIQEGDEILFNTWEYLHGVCNRKNLFDQEKKNFKEIFQKAGFKKIRMRKIPNGYCPCEKCAPWFIVTTEYGPIKIGWRKRVINIDTKKLQEKNSLPDNVFLPLFKKEDVTKWETGIHAWGFEKAQDYLGRIRIFLTQIPK